MKNEDKVYLYSDGSMCRVINENDKTAKQVDPFIVRQKLKLLGSCYEDNGTYFVLKDDNNRIYYMSQSDFNKYVEKHDIVLDSEFEFMTHGKTQSIREIEVNDKWVSLREKQPELEFRKFYAISKPLKIKTFVGCEFIARYKITLVPHEFPIVRKVFIIYGLNENVTLNYDKVQYWKEIEE